MPRPLLISTLALLLLPTLSFADELRPPSRIVAVEVETTGATVTRALDVAISSGGTLVILPDLPAAVDRQTIRVRGEGAFSIGAVDTRALPADPRPANAPELEKRLKELRDKRAGFDADLAAADSRKKLADALLANPALAIGAGDNARPLTTETLAVLATFVEDSHRKASETALDVARRRAVIDAEIAVLQERLRADPTRRRALTELRVSLAPAGAEPVSGRLEIDYRVGEARWTPVYDARLSTSGAAPALEVVRRGEVVQRTGEEWNNVRLTLSTARVTGRTMPPDLASLLIAFEAPPVPLGAVSAPRPPAPMPMRARDLAGQDRQEADLLKAEERAAIEPEAQIAITGIDARFVIPGAISVAGTGEAVSVRIETIEASPRLTAIAVPALDPTAYLQARYQHASDAPLLPGRVALYRDGVFVGDGRFGLIASGDVAELGFGADPRIKIKRTPVARNEATSGILSAWRVETREAAISVKNLSGVPMSIRLLDRMPFAEAAEITIETLPGTTAPSERDVEGKRGVVAFAFDIGAGADKTVRTGWRITSPKDKRVIELERAGG